MLESYKKSGSKFTFQQYQYNDKTAEIIGPQSWKQVWVRQYDMGLYRRYLCAAARLGIL